jgi:hypothetical protein
MSLYLYLEIDLVGDVKGGYTGKSNHAQKKMLSPPSPTFLLEAV